jgi:FkbM family methyltransferase
MRHAARKLGFVLAASSHGPLILDRFDYQREGDRLFGVGGEILEWSHFDPAEVDLLLGTLRWRRQYFGDGVVMIDCGANIGVHTIEAAVEMTGWGSVLAIEAQERLYYALAGNIALNNCFNARAVHAAVGAQDGTIQVPAPDYLSPGSFGSLELRPQGSAEDIGQKIDYSPDELQEIRCLQLDSQWFARIDVIKVDVEGMEMDVLAGAQQMIMRHRPIILIEWLKSPKAELQQALAGFGYRIFEIGRNFLAVHPTDASIEHLQQSIQPTS